MLLLNVGIYFGLVKLWKLVFRGKRDAIDCTRLALIVNADRVVKRGGQILALGRPRLNGLLPNVSRLMRQVLRQTFPQRSPEHLHHVV